MKSEVLTKEKAKELLGTELIQNGRGTQALHETVVAYRANRRQGTRGTKTKATVQGSGKKPWKQKGTGRARAGYRSSPIWRGGGVVFGPQPRDFSKNTPLKVKRLALLKALSERVKDEDVIVVDSFKVEEPKTKALLEVIKGLKLENKKLLIVLNSVDKNIYLAARNVKGLEVVVSSDVNAEHLLRYDKVILTSDGVGKIAERLKKLTEKKRS